MSYRKIVVLSVAALVAALPRVADAQFWSRAKANAEAPASTDAYAASPARPDSEFDAGTFRFGSQSRTALQLLWEESMAAGEERVACIGGFVEEGAVHITKVSRLEPAFADSARVSAASSLRECRPPEWIGTVHTHIAKFNGMPYTTFSAPDREVMHRWSQRWDASGTFCILYSEFQAHCEVSSGTNGDAVYSARPVPQTVAQRGNSFGGTNH
ncbi:MAG TPA: hypothetical protein VKA84_22135 [Gemmatimonadaceae bacterium]|nr:hypothetical protein [Gemmatimonadaceae bacterium]